MLRLVVSSLILISVLCLTGCGGSSSSGGGGGLSVVYIQPDRVSQRNVRISVDGRVRWINSTSALRQVVSGTLEELGSPLVEHIVEIRSNGFVPGSFEANFGDTIKFNNLTGATFDLQVVDTSGDIVARENIPSGQLSRAINFRAAGKYTYRKASNTLFAGNVILFGQPSPSGQFQSPVLSSGGTFTVQFEFPEFIPYYILDVNNPNRSFITGTVMIQ